MEDSNKWGFFAMGMGFGFLAGVVIALLITPQSGQQSRDLIADKISDVGGRVKEVTASREKIYKETWKKPTAKPYSSGYENTN
jgi:gas vesicle protein